MTEIRKKAVYVSCLFAVVLGRIMPFCPQVSLSDSRNLRQCHLYVQKGTLQKS